MPEDYLTFIVGALTGLIAGFAALAAYYVGTRQNLLSAKSVAGDWYRDLRAWASEAVDVLAEAAYCCPRSLNETSTENKQKIVHCRCHLSSLIDRGRFLLPNEREKEYGLHKAGAYQGYRSPALDALVAAERVLNQKIDLFAFPSEKHALIALRREFVSIIQAILDPRSMNKSVASILLHAQEDRKRDPTMGGLLPDSKKVPEGAEGRMYIAARRYEESRSKNI